MDLSIKSILDYAYQVDVKHIVSLETSAIQSLAKKYLSNADLGSTLWTARIGTIGFAFATFHSLKVPDEAGGFLYFSGGCLYTALFAAIWFHTSIVIKENLYLHDVCMQVLKDRGVTLLH